MAGGVRTAGLTLVIFLIGAATSPASVRFRETSRVWGIDFRHHHGGSGAFYMPETMGSGVAILDYDEDGDEDLLFVDSGPLPGYEGPTPRTRLFRNEGSHRFVDVTSTSGIAVTAYGMGAVAGDVDGDADLDLYVTEFGPNQLFENQGDGTFRDVSAASGADDASWGASAVLFDAELDGDLDLYVTNYVDFSVENNPPCGIKERGILSYCHPDVYDGLPDRFFRNDGRGVFREATREAGFGDAGGKGLGVVSGDVDRDGWPDLYVANDMTPNFLFHNGGDGTFTDVALVAGVALSGTGEPEAGMGLILADLEGDALPELLVTHLDLQTNAVYGNVGDLLFVDRRYTSGLAEPSIRRVGFGATAGDYDQDGRIDIAIANGHIIHNIELWGRGITYRQPNQVFRNLGGGRFEEVADSGLDVVRASRGLAQGDLDGDGDLDLAVNDSNEEAEVYENVGAAGAWIAWQPWPSPGATAIGALVEVTAGETTLRREIETGGSYLSQSSLVAHFGLGVDAPGPDRLTVRWPGDRATWRLLHPPARRRISPPFTEGRTP